MKHTHTKKLLHIHANKQTTHQFAHSLASYNSCWLRWFSLRVENMSAILELQFQTCSAIDSRNLVTYRNGIEDREMANERTEPVSQTANERTFCSIFDALARIASHIERSGSFNYALRY